MKTVTGDGPGYSILVITVHLNRRMIFSSYILTFPVIFLGFLTPLLFWLPSGSVDKADLGKSGGITDLNLLCCLGMDH